MTVDKIAIDAAKEVGVISTSWAGYRRLDGDPEEE